MLTPEALTEVILSRVWNPETCPSMMSFMDPEQGEAISDATPALPVDWSSIASVCEERSVVLDKNDPDFLTAGFRYMRMKALDENRVEHRDNCWLGKNYANDPKAWAHGCDCGATARAAQKRKNDG